MTRDRDWVCLMYHDIATDAPGLTGGAEYFSVSQAGFDRQLSMIADMGARGCSIADALATPGGPRVVISFDDGDLGQATRGFPTLVAHRMTATFFVTTNWIGRSGYASWDQLREMRDAGMSIQSHTHSHPFLSELGPEALREELHRSRELIDQHLGQQTTMIALPGGDAPRRALASMLRDEGYGVVATSRWGINTDGPIDGLRYVRRCTVRGEPAPDTFKAMASGDRWLALKRRSRESVLAFIRSSLGPTRYARLRRRLLNAAGSSGTADG